MLDARRRDLITLLGGAAAAWPVVAHGQQPAMPVIGVLNPTRRDANPDRLRGFRQGLKDTGYVEGENVAIEYRWAENQPSDLPTLAADLARRQVAVSPGSHRRAGCQGCNHHDPHRLHCREDPVGLALSRASPGRVATYRHQFSQRLSWWRSGWNSCVSWCPERSVWPCSSIQPLLRMPSPR